MLFKMYTRWAETRGFTRESSPVLGLAIRFRLVLTTLVVRFQLSVSSAR